MFRNNGGVVVSSVVSQGPEYFYVFHTLILRQSEQIAVFLAYNRWLNWYRYSITYCDHHVNCIWSEVDHDWLNRHGWQSDTPGEEEEENETAKKDAPSHGDAHVQLSRMQ